MFTRRISTYFYEPEYHDKYVKIKQSSKVDIKKNNISKLIPY